ncbi:L,D-transpeptidase [Acaryochloris sp. IP29b_bin.137]|uniref:L,D-transpeptidase n=1 Tax=Acaryochloris sp. IP29b_bin.137 TaxID=2969217 RepID=UPI002630EABE|nr:L,D-transpeptidase [Acaryochloris sp. IP29b_bin.137]
MKIEFIKIACIAISIGTLTLFDRAEAVERNIPETPLPNLAQPRNYLPSAHATRRLELSISRRRVTLFQNDQILKSYPVAVGKAGWPTPVGDFAVKTKVRNPPWQNPFRGKGYVIPGGALDNPLGTRWLGFWTNGKNWIGFHGTPNRSSVGSAASHGCVRMYDEDIQELFELVAVGTPVKVIR